MQFKALVDQTDSKLDELTLVTEELFESLKVNISINNYEMRVMSPTLDEMLDVDFDRLIIRTVLNGTVPFSSCFTSSRRGFDK